MNKYLLCALVLISSYSFAQDEEAAFELGDEAIENPLVNPDEVVKEDIAPVEKESEQTLVEKIEEAGEVIDEKKAATAAVKTEDEFAPPAAMPSVIAKSDTNQVVADMSDKKAFNQRESHWLTTFAFEGMNYELLPEDFTFTGKKDFKQESQTLFGGRLGFGGELYLGAGFITRSTIDGYYMGTLFSQIKNGGSYDDDVKFAFTKKVGQIYGADVSQSFGWMFDLKTKNPFMNEMTYMTMELFVDAGIGYAKAYNRVHYSYKLASTDEEFKYTVNDDLLNARVGAGINITGNNRFFLILKASMNRYDITKRNVDSYIKPNGSSPTSSSGPVKDAKIDPIVIYTLGGGYKF